MTTPNMTNHTIELQVATILKLLGRRSDTVVDSQTTLASVMCFARYPTYESCNTKVKQVFADAGLHIEVEASMTIHRVITMILHQYPFWPTVVAQ